MITEEGKTPRPSINRDMIEEADRLYAEAHAALEESRDLKRQIIEMQRLREAAEERWRDLEFRAHQVVFGRPLHERNSLSMALKAED